MSHVFLTVQNVICILYIYYIYMKNTYDIKKFICICIMFRQCRMSLFFKGFSISFTSVKHANTCLFFSGFSIFLYKCQTLCNIFGSDTWLFFTSVWPKNIAKCLTLVFFLGFLIFFTSDRHANTCLFFSGFSIFLGQTLSNIFWSWLFFTSVRPKNIQNLKKTNKCLRGCNL